eukprot:scaffold1241_cov227-Pinguiococcus_pyrenoidosus.AAC.4
MAGDWRLSSAVCANIVRSRASLVEAGAVSTGLGFLLSNGISTVLESETYASPTLQDSRCHSSEHKYTEQRAVLGATSREFPASRTRLKRPP